MASAKWVVFDAEADGLNPTKFYCVSYHDYQDKKGTLTDYEDIRLLFQSYDVYVGHNIRRWDLPNLRRVVGIDFPNRIVDTLSVSWYLEPKRKKAGLKEYGVEFGVPKPKIVDWYSQKLSDYIHRCEEDVRINLLLWKKQLEYLNKLYSEPEDLWRFLKYLDFKMWCAVLAEESRWKLDIEFCITNKKRLEEERDNKFAELQRVMPKVPIVKEYERPKRLRNADGQLSVLGQKWQERLDRAGLPEEYDGIVEEVVGYDDGNPKSHPQLKEWLYSLGWVPITFKETKSKTTGDVKSVPQISKEAQKGGGLCDSVKLLYEKEPNLKLLDGFFVLNHRISLLDGFLRDVDGEGFVSARVAGLANTLRFKHAELVNLPRITSRYGTEVRGCLTVPDNDHELCGADMSGLEDRLKQHFLFPHDPEYVKTMMSDDWDPHLDLAVQAGAITKDDADYYKFIESHPDKELSLEEKNRYKKIKTYRSIYKNGNYACQYGAGVKRLMITCGCDYDTAERVHQTYWKRNWAIKKVSNDQVVRTINEQMWLFNPISGFWYSLRTKKDVFSTLVQGSAVYCFDTWVSHVVNVRPQLTGQYHDEIILLVKKGNRDDIRDFLKETIQETNEFLGLNRKLDVGIQFGERYSEIH